LADVNLGRSGGRQKKRQEKNRENEGRGKEESTPHFHPFILNWELLQLDCTTHSQRSNH
jgi:hypothetical protein